MNNQMISILLVESSKLISQYLRSRPVSLPQPEIGVLTLETEVAGRAPGVILTEDSTQATQASTGCLPCSIGHLGTCSGLLNEAMRFARSDGITSLEVTTRMNQCLDELNTMERVDLRPELIINLPPWQKKLAEKALAASRGTRHGLETLVSVEGLEAVAASTQSVRNEIGSTYITTRIKTLNPQEQAELRDKVLAKAMEIKDEIT